jgi:glycosyltransferase involved in cell wall biosynthesis
MLDKAEIPYLWLNFSNNQMDDAPKNFYNMGIRLDVQNYMQKADYIVQLSTVEACSNTVIEALNLNVPLICTPVPSFFELGVKDGVNAHVVPFDMNFDVNKLLQIPKFRVVYNNKRILEKWREIL